MPAAYKDSQAWASTDLPSQTLQVLLSTASQEMNPPLEPSSQDIGLPLEPASQHLGTCNQPVVSTSQESEAPSPLVSTAVQPFDTSSEPMPAASQQVPSASQPVAGPSSHAGAASQEAAAASQETSAASQEASAASQLPDAPIKPVPTSSQQPGTDSVNRRTDSGSQPGASVKGPDQAFDQGLYSASLHSGSQAGVVMLLCILSLMPR